MKTNNAEIRKGLTLIEMLVAVFMVTIILSAAAVTMIYGQRSLDREWEQVRIQRDASYAMLKIKRAVRSASQAVITDSGKGFKVYKDEQWIECKYLSDERDIRYKVLAEDEEWDDHGDDDAITIVDDIVESANFSIDASSNSTLVINLFLKKGEFCAYISSSATMRNFVSGS